MNIRDYITPVTAAVIIFGVVVLMVRCMSIASGDHNKNKLESTLISTNQSMVFIESGKLKVRLNSGVYYRYIIYSNKLNQSLYIFTPEGIITKM